MRYLRIVVGERLGGQGTSRLWEPAEGRSVEPARIWPMLALWGDGPTQLEDLLAVPLLRRDLFALRAGSVWWLNEQAVAAFCGSETGDALELYATPWEFWLAGAPDAGAVMLSERGSLDLVGVRRIKCCGFCSEMLEKKIRAHLLRNMPRFETAVGPVAPSRLVG